MDWVKEFSNPIYTAYFQKVCGVVNYGRDVVDNNNLQIENTQEKLTGRRLNGVKNGYHHGDFKRGDAVKCSTHEQIGNREMNFKTNTDRKLCVFTSCHGIRYSLKSRAVYYGFKVAAFLGTAEFFLGFFPFLLWNVDSLLARQTIFVWSLTMYFGQAAKDVIRWPRPSSPPVVYLETHHNDEYGMPSTHALAGTVIPTTLLLLTYNRYEVSPYLCATIVVIWSLMVCLSRLYLGVHSVSDVVCGAAVSVVFMITVLPYINQCDWYIQTHMTAPFVMVVIGLAMCTIFYPPVKDTLTKADTTEVVAASVGVLLSFWINYNIGFSTAVHISDKMPLSMPSFEWFFASLLRFLLGVAVIVSTHTLVSKLSLRVISYMVGLKIPDKYHPSVRIPCKFVTYLSVGLMISGPTPYLIKWLGFCRNGFLQEVL